MTSSTAFATACAFLAAALLSFPGTAQERREVPEFRTFGAPAIPEDAEMIDVLVERYEDAWSRQDTQAFVALHAQDAEWINAYARIFQSAESLRQFLENRLFPAFDRSVSEREADAMRTISVRYVGDDAAVVHLYTESQRGPARDAAESARRTHVHLVLAKQRGAWKVVHTAIMDAR
jgi:uncharacterized protein (TIGR02246 family)